MIPPVREAWLVAIVLLFSGCDKKSDQGIKAYCYTAGGTSHNCRRTRPECLEARAAIKTAVEATATAGEPTGHYSDCAPVSEAWCHTQTDKTGSTGGELCFPTDTECHESRMWIPPPAMRDLEHLKGRVNGPCYPAP